MYRLVAASDCGTPFLGPLRHCMTDAENDANHFRLTHPQSVNQIHKFFQTLRAVSPSSRNFRLSSATVDTSELFSCPIEDVCDFLGRLHSEIASLQVHVVDEYCAISMLTHFRSERETLHEQVAVAETLDPVTRADLTAALHGTRVQLMLVLEAVENLVAGKNSNMAVFEFQLLLAHTRVTLDVCGTVMQLTRGLLERRHC